MREEQKSKFLRVRISESLLSDLRKCAKLDERDFSDNMRRVLQKYVDKRLGRKTEKKD